MRKVAVITSIHDGYDTLKPVCSQEGLEVDWVFVTDNPPDDPMGWRVVHESWSGIHPNRAAKLPKLFPWDYTDAEASVWIDGSFRILSSRFLMEALEFADPIAQFNHPWRDCLFDEAVCTLALDKYISEAEKVEHQIKKYGGRNHPNNWGLWATGVIAREHTDSVRKMSNLWFQEIALGSFQDQVSQPYALRMSGLRPSLFPNDYFSSPWIRYEGSSRH